MAILRSKGQMGSFYQVYPVDRVLIPKILKIRHVNIAIKVGKCIFVQRKMPEDKTKGYFETDAQTKKCNTQKRNWFRHFSVISRTFHHTVSRGYTAAKGVKW